MSCEVSGPLSSPPHRSVPRVLILGGSSEASALAAALAGRADVTATLSLAGRVRNPAAQPLPVRVGGFGGAAGLAAYLRAERIDLIVDATHPFARTISRNAEEAARRTGVYRVSAVRAGWRPEPDDRWQEVDTMADAAASLGTTPRRVFLTVGRLQLRAFAAAPQHMYLVRSIDPVDADHGLKHAAFVTARGPFAVDEEISLMREHGTEVLVAKNSGGAASIAKLVAARRLRLPVVLLRPPPGTGGDGGVASALAAIDRLVVGHGRDQEA